MDYIPVPLYYFTMKNISCSPQILFAHYWECSPNWSWNPRNNGWEGYELWLVVSGKGRVKAKQGGEVLYSLSRGSCLAYRMDKSYHVEHDGNSPLRIFGVHFITAEQDDPPPEFIHKTDPTLLKSLLARTVECYARGDRDKSTIYFMAALEEYVRRDEPNPEDDPWNRYPVNELVRAIREHPERRLSLKEMASDVNSTPNTLMRKVRKLTGLTPVELRNRILIDLARQYLHATNMSLEEISHILGFSDRYYFSRVFKNHIGRPPGYYRHRPR